MDVTEEDRISELPEHLLVHIFSFLPLKLVVSTCILSKRWRYLYTSTPILDFIDFFDQSQCFVTKEEDKVKTERFMNFVDKLLPLFPALHDDINTIILPTIQKCCLYIGTKYFDKSRVTAWIITLVTKRKVEQLSFLFYVDFVFPPCFFTSKTLTVLELEYYNFPQLPESILFPSLKVIRFRHTFMDENIMEKFSSGCPVLEELSLECCVWKSSKPNMLCISAPALSCLIITGCSRLIGSESDGKIKIHAPNLLSLVYKGATFKDHVLTHRFSSIIDANIAFFPQGMTYEKRSSAGKLLAGICNVKLLKLSNEIFEVLSLDDEEPLPNLPIFCNLIHLEVTTDIYGSSARPLIDFLRVTPNLESLAFNKGFYKWSSGKNPVWAKKSIPECLLLKLKVIEFREFHGTHRELQAVTYFLKNSRVLEKMTVLCYPLLPTTKKNKIMKKLVKFQKGSTSCFVNLSYLPEDY